MSLKIPDTDFSYYNQHRLKSMRELIVNDIEKFRLEINNKLVYAKVKINLNAGTNIKDGNGVPLSNYYEHIDSWKKTIYAFYQDGLYDNYYRKLEDDYLSTCFNSKYYQGPAKFKGGYTAEGKQINNIEDIYHHTDGFDFKDNPAESEVTLYGRGEGITFTVRVHNIRRKTASSSCKYKGKTITDGLIATFKVPYNTEIYKYLSDKITNMKYVTGANYALDGTPNGQKLREGPQKFIGGSLEEFTEYDGGLKEQKIFMKEYLYTGFNNSHQTVVDIYPVFETLVIGAKTVTEKSQTSLGGDFTTYSLSTFPTYYPVRYYIDKKFGVGYSFNDKDKNGNIFYRWNVVDYDTAHYEVGSPKEDYPSQYEVSPYYKPRYVNGNNAIPYFSSTIIVKPTTSFESAVAIGW